jgi:hypothetical protein
MKILMRVEKKQVLNYVREVNQPLKQNLKFTQVRTLMDMQYKFVKEVSKDWMVKNNVQELTVKNNLFFICGGHL